jgi:spore germination protein
MKVKEDIRKEIFPKVENNIEYLKSIFEDSSDVIFRTFNIKNYKAALVYIDGMADRNLLCDFLLEPVMLFGDKIKDLDEMKEKILAISDLSEETELDKAVTGMLSGDTLFFIENYTMCYVIASRFFPTRGVTEPQGETVIRGSREGFTEGLRFNTALIRRRIRDSRLKFKPLIIGERSKTSVALTYIDDIVNQEVLKEVEERLDKIDIDAILDSGYIHQLIEDSKWSLFPQIQSTERPDVVAAGLYEGRVGIVVDNSPFVLVIPGTLTNFFQSPDDYYQRWIYSSIVRIIRLIAIFLSLILPGLYVSITSFHTAAIPTELAYAIAATREGIPFPAYIEAVIMEISLALLLEAVVRLPRPIGATVGIVGGLIIGQAAVSAGIVSPIMVIVVAVTAITSFITPNYEVTVSFRMIRFFLIVTSSIIGLYGLTIGLIVVLIHLVTLKSFGIPYMSPIVGVTAEDMKDVFIRSPLKSFKYRPGFMNTGDKIRQK